jgi:hypothetical protein
MGIIPEVHNVEKINAMSIRILVSPNCSGVKYFGKKYSTLMAPKTNPAYMNNEE